MSSTPSPARLSGDIPAGAAQLEAETSTASDAPGSPERLAGNAACRTGIGRPRLDRWFLLQTFAVAAIAGVLFPFQRLESLVVVGVILLTWLFGCRRTRAGVAMVVPVMMLPFAWLLVIDYPWTEYRWLWVRSWALLPGLYPAKGMVRSEPAVLWTAAGITVATFLGAVTVIRFWPRLRWWTVGSVALVCATLSWGLFLAFFM